MIREVGILGKVRALRRPGSVWRLYRYSFDLTAPLPDAAPGPQLVDVNQPDLDEMRANCPDLTDRKYEQLRERIGSSDISAYLIKDADGTWAGYCHLIYRRFEDHYLNHVVRMKAKEVLFVDDQVFRSHRRRGLHTFSVLRRCQLAQDRGARTALVVINDKNTASIATYRHVGIRPARRLFFLRPFRLMIQIPVWKS